MIVDQHAAHERLVLERLRGAREASAEMIAAAYEEKRTGAGPRASELIAAARAERLSTIDAEAAPRPR